MFSFVSTAVEYVPKKSIFFGLILRCSLRSNTFIALVGDVKYSTKRASAFDREQLHQRVQLLHAWQLIFTAHGKEYVWKAELPDNFAQVLRRLGIETEQNSI